MTNDPSEIREPHLLRGDFVGVFAILRSHGHILMVANDRRIGGERARTWDLPGGQVEPGESLMEALHRELREETGWEFDTEPEFAFVQDGIKIFGERRMHAWRSFFFEIALPESSSMPKPGQPREGDEVVEVAWRRETELQEQLSAPYHDSFRRWLTEGGTFFTSKWREPKA